MGGGCRRGCIGGEAGREAAGVEAGDCGSGTTVHGGSH